MKNKICAVSILLLMFTAIFAQGEKNITKFLGIPVDGFASEMKEKIEAKGFVYDEQVGFHKGEFNGYDVYISVVTDNNKVYRIFLLDAVAVNQTNIINRYNKLYCQFNENKKYIADPDNKMIPENEDLGYEMTVNNKSYEADFFQVGNMMKDTAFIQEKLIEKFNQKYTEDDLANITENDKQKIINELSIELVSDIVKEASNKQVWFNIQKNTDGYRIAMFYDNLCNQANGEDL